MRYDVAIAGGGPAGATCAAFCAKAGLKTLLIERVVFPREKVCGDCLNPRCWPIFDRLGVADRILASPHAKLNEVRFVGLNGHSISVPFERGGAGEIAIRRRELDDLLLQRAIECGVEVRQGVAISAVEQGWRISFGHERIEAKALVAADGRNSTVARLLGLLPAASKDRIGSQTHIAAPADFGARIELRFFPDG
ncbi:MAG: FAD-dependent monooxygenase, partial [Verrucomicrobiota bacterium]|nr:FAD-dependent monooxygenase [Verrucomicrobiota bacterium]